VLLGYAQLLGNLADAQQLRLLGDFDVGQWHFFFLSLAGSTWAGPVRPLVIFPGFSQPTWSIDQDNSFS
jgi:hypothetical protein